MNIKNFFNHLSTVRRHRRWVRYFCFKLGYYKRGLFHDLSKYSPIELKESIKYYQGTSSPINVAKKENGWSAAWQHHKGRNTHHYEYWADRFDNGTVMLPMPYDDMMEMIADYFAAAATYSNITKKNKLDASFYAAEKAWWDNKKENCSMNKVTKEWVSYYFTLFANEGQDFLFKKLKYASKFFDKAAYERDCNNELEAIKKKFDK